jgi:type I restriction enzyme S subunit
VGVVSALELEIPKGYLKTEYGIFPSDWSVLTLDDVCSFAGGAQPEKSVFSHKEQSGYIRLIQIRDYKSDKDIVYIPEKLARKKCLTTDIMIGRYGPPIFQILRGIEGAYNVALIKATPKENIEREFLYYFLKNDSLFELMDMLSQRSSGQTGVELPALKSYPIGLPTKKEQTAIANALSDVDALISELEKLIAKKQAIKTATMQQLLTGRTRLPQFALRQDGTPTNSPGTNLDAGAGGPKGEGQDGLRKSTKSSELGEIPEDWEVKTYGEVFTFLSTSTNSRADLSEDGDFGYVHYGDIHTEWNNKLDLNKERLPRISKNIVSSAFVMDGDLIMADASEDYEGIGKTVEVFNVGDKQLVAGLHTFLLRDKEKVLADGFRGYLHSIPAVKSSFDRLATGMKVYGISKNNLSSVCIPVPSLEEQTAIATILSDMDAEIQALEQRLGKTRQIKQGMMQELLTGKTRLIKGEAHG